MSMILVTSTCIRQAFPGARRLKMPSWPTIRRSTPANQRVRIKLWTTSGGEKLLRYDGETPEVKAILVALRRLPAVQAVENHRGLMFRVCQWNGRLGQGGLVGLRTGNWAITTKHGAMDRLDLDDLENRFLRKAFGARLGRSQQAVEIIVHFRLAPVGDYSLQDVGKLPLKKVRIIFAVISQQLLHDGLEVVRMGHCSTIGWLFNIRVYCADYSGRCTARVRNFVLPNGGFATPSKLVRRQRHATIGSEPHARPSPPKTKSPPCAAPVPNISTCPPSACTSVAGANHRPRRCSCCMAGGTSRPPSSSSSTSCRRTGTSSPPTGAASGFPTG